MAEVDIKKELEKHDILLSVMPDYYYSESIADMVKKIQDKRICYVDLNKGTDTMVKLFSSNKIDTKNIFFIDGVSMAINSNAQYENAILLSSPYALTEIALAISEVFRTKAFDVLIFDSLSTLNVYAKEIRGVSGKFTSAMVNKLRSRKNKGVLTCLENDTASELVMQSSLFVDRVVKAGNNPDFIKESSARAAAVIAVMLVFGSLSFFYTVQQQPTGMGITDISSNTSQSGFAAFAFISFILGLISLLFIAYRKKYPMVKISLNIPERKNLEKITKEFKSKLSKWLKGIREISLW